MKARWSLAKSKYDRFQRHHRRLRDAPDPVVAARSFERKLQACRRIERSRMGFYGLVYIGFIGAAALTILSLTHYLEVVGYILRLIVSFAPILVLVGFLGVLVCTRALSHLEVDLFYYSSEARMTNHKR